MRASSTSVTLPSETARPGSYYVGKSELGMPEVAEKKKSLRRFDWLISWKARVSEDRTMDISVTSPSRYICSTTYELRSTAVYSLVPPSGERKPLMAGTSLERRTFTIRTYFVRYFLIHNTLNHKEVNRTRAL